LKYALAKIKGTSVHEFHDILRAVHVKMGLLKLPYF